jgi:hypothetical protein
MTNNIEDILGKPSEPSNFSTFGDFTPFERQMIMAELYHNAWYDQERFEQMYDLYNKWANNPVKECKFILPEKEEEHEEQI